MTGELQRSVSPTLRVTAGGAVADVAVTAPHARYVLDGTPAHTIVPTKASVLSWTNGGTRFFARSVQHPGTRAQDYLYNAEHSGLVSLDRGVDAAVDKLVKRVSG